MSSIKTLAVAATLAIVLICCCEVSSQTVGVGVGGACGPNEHCTVNVGLICGEDKKCGCGSGQLNHGISFDMEWDTGKNLCVAKPGSACVGTGSNPVSEGQKNVQCKEGACNQVENMPPGVGVCGAGGNGNNGAERIAGFGLILPVVVACLLGMRN